MLTPLLALGFAFLLGLCFGSFANVVIYRLPLLGFAREWRKTTDAAERRELLEYIDDDAARAKGKLDTALAMNLNIATTRSHCPHCRRTLTALDLVPLLSWLLLRGRCRTCGGAIAARYPLVELVCGLVLAAMYLRFGLQQDWISLVLYAAVGVALVIVLFIDLDYRMIPNEITYGGVVLGLLVALLPHYPWADQTVHLAGLWQGFIGALIAGGLALVIFEVGYRLYGKEVFGMGDVKLMCMLGALLGWQLGLLTFFLANIFGAFFGVSMVALRIATMKSMIPFGPYIVYAAFATILAGPELIAGYSRFMEM